MNEDQLHAEYIEIWPLIIGPGWICPPEPPALCPRAKALYFEWMDAHRDLSIEYKAKCFTQTPYVTSLRAYRERTN